ALHASSAEVQHLRQLMAETGALFGARHYRRYDFLLSLSDAMPPDGVEHHESSDNRTPEALFLDPEVRETQMDLLAHEFTHSWNGKYRRPIGLVSPDYQTPLKGDLLWVYEGLTQYLGVMLTARSGFWTPEPPRRSFTERLGRAQRGAAALITMTKARSSGWKPTQLSAGKRGERNRWMIFAGDSTAAKTAGQK